MPHTCDVLVLGGGVLGTSIALHLARRGAGRVTLLERAYLGAGASGKSSAIVHQSHACPLTAELAREGLAAFERFPEEFGGPAVFWRTGAVWLAPADRGQPGPTGSHLRPIGSQELMEVDPSARVADDEAAAFERQAGYVECVQVLASLADAARRAGAELLEGVEVRALRADKGRLQGVETNEGVYECGRLVLAAGAWTARLAGDAGVELPVRPARTQVALFRRPPDSGRRGAVFIDHVQGIYLRPAHGDLVHAGSLAPPGEETDPDQCGEGADDGWLADMRQRLVRRCPALYRAFGRGGYSAPLGDTPDGRPVLDRLPGLEDAFCAAGFRGDAFLLALPVGRLTAEWVLTGRPGTDLSSFGLGRFREAPPPEKAKEDGQPA